MNGIVTDVFASKDYKRSRSAYCMECAFEYFVALLFSGSFLTKLLIEIGMDDAMIGVVSSFISLAFLFQLLSIFVVQKVTNTKVFVIIFHFASQIVFMSMYLLPFLPVGNATVKKVLAIGGILLAYFGNYFVTSMIYRWGNSYVHPDKRGSYGATKEMISLISGMVVTLIVGFAFDAFEDANNLYGGFIFAAVGIFIFSLCDLICLLLIKNDIKPKVKEKAPSIPMREVMKNTLGNRNYLNAIILYVLFMVGNYFTTGFIATYELTTLGLTVGATQIINIAGHGARFALSKPFGRYSDKRSFIKGIELALMLIAISFLLVVFTTPSTWFLIIFYVIVHNISAAGTSANFSNITYSYVDEKYFVQASAIKNSIGGVCGFLSSVVAGLLVKHIQGNGNTLFGISVNAPQVLGLVSTLIFVGAFIFAKLVVEKQKIMRQ